MKTTRIVALLAFAAIGTVAATAQQATPLLRDEVSGVKKKLVAVLDALGKATDGFAVKSENFSLPTDAYPQSGGKTWQHLSASVSREYSTEVGQEKAGKDLEEEYKKKMLEAQAKNDYQAMAKIGQEMQQKSAQMQMKASEGHKDPVSVHASLNGGAYEAIDPDAVLFEKPGVIALKSQSDLTSGKERVVVYFDPVALKSTAQLSRVELKFPEEGVASKTSVLHITVELDGPIADVEAWAKRIDTAKILAQISGH
jgi:hypothetical protein